MKFENGEKTIFLQATVRENSSLCVYDFANNIEKVRFVVITFLHLYFYRDETVGTSDMNEIQNC